MSQGPRLQVEAFQTSDSSQTGYAVINEESGAIAIDFSQYYERIATALETLATLSSTTGVKTISTLSEDSTSAQYSIVNEISDKLAIVATTLSSISNSSAEIAQASENTSNSLAGIFARATGAGIHMKGPLDWLGLVSTYKLYVENVGPDNVTLQGLIEYKAKIDLLPKEF